MIQNFLKNCFSFKIFFSKPKHEKILLYDSHSKPYAEILFKKKNFAIYHTRYESINIFVFLFTIINNGIYNLKHNYKVNYFNFVNPKIVYTIIDNNIGFFKLKNYFPNMFFVADQKAVRNNEFYQICKEHLKNFPDQKLMVDIFLFWIKRKKKIIKNY